MILMSLTKAKAVIRVGRMRLVSGHVAPGTRHGSENKHHEAALAHFPRRSNYRLGVAADTAAPFVYWVADNMRVCDQPNPTHSADTTTASM